MISSVPQGRVLSTQFVKLREIVSCMVNRYEDDTIIGGTADSKGGYLHVQLDQALTRKWTKNCRQNLTLTSSK